MEQLPIDDGFEVAAKPDASLQLRAVNETHPHNDAHYEDGMPTGQPGVFEEASSYEP